VIDLLLYLRLGSARAAKSLLDAHRKSHVKAESVRGAQSRHGACLTLREVNMRRLLLAGLVSTLAAGCASNKAADEPSARIRDTTITPRDTVNPNDTLPHIRDSLPDSTLPR